MSPRLKRSSYLVLVLTFACSPYDAAWVSPKFGVTMSPEYADPNYISPEVADTSAAWLADHFVGLGFARADVEDRFTRMVVVTYPDVWACGSGRCAGQQSLYILSVALAYDGVPMCVWQTALMHEMAHALLETLTPDHDPDSGHTRPEVWSVANATLGTCP